MPEQCGCHEVLVAEEAANQSTFHAEMRFCKLHARAAEMRELLKQYFMLMFDREPWPKPLSSEEVWEWKECVELETRALLEETK